MIRVVTTFSRKQWDDYVHVLLPKSIELWPREVEWQVWHDSHTAFELIDYPRTVNVVHKFLEDDPEHEAFMARWHKRVAKNAALKAEITIKRYPTGYTLDAGTFAHKVFAYTSKEARDGAEWLIFLGSDVETLRTVDMAWLGGVLAGDISHLGRRDIRSSETDWLAVQSTEHGRRFLDATRHIYVSGDLYENAEWVDGFVTARLCAAFKGMGADISNLSEGLPGINVWEKTVLAEKMIHHKGMTGKRTIMEKLRDA
jgi:hypothetical protein